VKTGITERTGASSKGHTLGYSTIPGRDTEVNFKIYGASSKGHTLGYGTIPGRDSEVHG
jgi:hypothetical protein